jgi:methionyl-tRNA formyltransferase
MSPYRQRILFLGMPGQFSYIVLARLLAAKVGVVAIAVDGRGETDVPLQLLPPQAPVGQLPLTTPYLQPTIIQLGWQQQIPVWQVGDMGAVALATAVTGTRQKQPPAVGVVACFSQRLPEQLLSLPRHGFLNLHPSRLPHFRGPEPLFWTFRAGVQQTGVTLHWLDAGLDTGDIALQADLTLPLGISGPEAERQTAELCAQLLIDGLQQLAAGRLPRRPQPKGGSYQSQPTAADFEIPTNWPATRAFHFMRGTSHWQRPYTIVLANGEKMVAQTAVAYSEQRGGETAVYPLAQPVSFNPGLLWVR